MCFSLSRGLFIPLPQLTWLSSLRIAWGEPKDLTLTEGCITSKVTQSTVAFQSGGSRSEVMHEFSKQTGAVAANGSSLLLLRSSKTITKEATIVTVVLGRPTPEPRLGAAVELSGGDTGGLFNLTSVGKTLSCQRVTSKEAPPAFLEVQPAG